MKSFKPPQNINFDKRSIFLAGSINRGNSIDWQKDVEVQLINYDINIFNPRRDDWNNDWDTSFENPQFYQQVKWELNGLKHANIIFFNFTEEGLSPISLLELGLIIGENNYDKSKQIVVCCPEKYSRSGNVEITCNEFGIILFTEFNEAISYIKNKL